MSTHVDLTVTLRYRGSKAQDFYPSSSLGIKILRKDLTALKLPHPKAENVTITKLPNGKGECAFFWPNAPYKGALHRNLSGRICGRDEDGSRKRLLDELSIDQLSLREKRLVPGHRHKQWVRPDAVSVLHAQPGLRNEAQMLLDDVAWALKMPKNEPMEPFIPDASSPARDSVASSVPSPPAPRLNLGIHSIEGDHNPPMSISSSWHASPVTPRPIKTLPISPTISSFPLPAQERYSTPPGLTMSTQTQTQAQARQAPTQTQLPSPTASSRKRSHSPDAWSRHTHAPPAPNGERQSKVTQLTRELWNVRRQITAGVAREATIMSELRVLDSRNTRTTKTSRAQSEESVMRARLRAVETELLKERKQRIQAEAALVDVQRECREPFVVPALFEAFFMISKLTTQAMDSNGQEIAT